MKNPFIRRFGRLVVMGACLGGLWACQQSPLPDTASTLDVDAGADQFVDASQVVELRGAVAPDAAAVEAISWTQIAGFEVDLDPEDTLSTGFTAPRVVQREELIFLLRVDSGGRQAEDMVSVVVDPPPLEAPADTANGGGLVGLLADLVGDTTEVLGSLLAVAGALTQPETLDERLEQLANTPDQVRDLVSTLGTNLGALLGPDSPDSVVAAIGQTLIDLSESLTTLMNDEESLPADLLEALRIAASGLGEPVGLNGGLAARQSEPVVLTGAALGDWSQPAAFGVPNNTLPTADSVRDAHDGRVVVPESVLRSGIPVDEIAAFRWSEGGFFEEIPVQVDERFPYFLSNDNSDFGVYSGTDLEVTYAWDRENWKQAATASARDEDGRLVLSAAYPEGEGPTPDPVAVLDDDDEVVFMARDAGVRAPDDAPPPGDDVVAVKEIALLDVLDPGTQRFVYLVRRPGGSRFDAGNGYVEYTRNANADEWIDRNFFRDEDPEKLGTSNRGYGANLAGPVAPPVDGYFDYERAGCAVGSETCESEDRFPRDGLVVQTDTYRWEASGRWMVRDLRVRPPTDAAVDWAARPDLIDRWKGRAFQQSPDSSISLVGFEDEQVNWEANATLLGERCGPVRCIRETWGADSGTNVTKTETFYRDAVSYHYRVRVHPIPPDGLYTSWDYNRDVAARYYTAFRPDGVPIDGVNDDVLQLDQLALPGCSLALEVVNALLDTELPNIDPSILTEPCRLYFDFPDVTFNMPLAFGAWEQVSGRDDAGSLAYVFEITGATTLVNPLIVPYYRDDACFDDGTGDDPVARPWPGEVSDDARVLEGYVAAAQARGEAVETAADLACEQKQGVHGAHGVHFLVLAESDNLFTGVPLTEANGRQWQFMVPTQAPKNVGAPYANIVRMPLQSIVVPRTF